MDKLKKQKKREHNTTKMRDIIKQIDWDKNDLIPAIVQDFQTLEVLMLAYMNKEALELSIKHKTAHYFSRSRKKIWQKGETSGNFQKIKDIYLDCDSDTLLLKVKQIGEAACHTGRKSCFFTNLLTSEIDNNINPSAISNYSIFDTLYHTIQDRKRQNDPSSSYVASLFAKGENTILKKIVEEAGELTFAIKDNDNKDIIYETADLAFHVLVALAYKDINPDLIKQELKRREGVSGIEEKNSRKQINVKTDKSELG